MENESLRIGLFIFILLFIFCLLIALENIRNYKKTGKIRFTQGWLPSGKWGKSYSKAQGKRAWYLNVFEIIFCGLMIIILSLALLVS